MDAVLLDTCLLLKSYLCDTLLPIAEEGVYRPLWSEHVLAELRRNLVKAGAKQEAVEHRLAQMAAYFPDAGDQFLSGLLELYPDAVLDALRRQASRYRREPRTAIALLNVLGKPRPRLSRVRPPVPHPAVTQGEVGQTRGCDAQG
jgi:hypothetical protein